MNDADDDADEDICDVCMTIGELISGCPSILGALFPSSHFRELSVVFVFFVISKRR